MAAKHEPCKQMLRLKGIAPELLPALPPKDLRRIELFLTYDSIMRMFHNNLPKSHFPRVSLVFKYVPDT